MEGEEEVPQIDLLAIKSSTAAKRQKLLQQLRQAAKDWGIFYVVNHGVPIELTQDVDAKFREFFALPYDLKGRLCASQPNQPYGYSSGGDERSTGPAWQEAMVVPNDMSTLATVFEHPSICSALMKYMMFMDRMSTEVLNLLAEALGINITTFSDCCKDCTRALRANYYHVFSRSSHVPGLAPHSDPNMLTILHQDQVDGLEIKKGERWIPVLPSTGSFTINIGDSLQVLSNDLYWSVEHRVVVKQSTIRRLSMAFFVSPRGDSCLVPPQTLVDKEHPFLYHQMTYSEFRRLFFGDGGMNGKRHLQDCKSHVF